MSNQNNRCSLAVIDKLGTAKIDSPLLLRKRYQTYNRFVDDRTGVLAHITCFKRPTAGKRSDNVRGRRSANPNIL